MVQSINGALSLSDLQVIVFSSISVYFVDIIIVRVQNRIVSVSRFDNIRSIIFSREVYEC